MPALITGTDQKRIPPIKRTSSRVRLRRLHTILITLLTLSLLAHLLTFVGLFAVRTMLRSQISQFAEGVQQAKSTTVLYNIPIDQQMPINLDIPIQRTIVVPIQTDIRINQTINVPIDTGFGVANLPIPIDATIPVSITVPIKIKESIPVSTTVPIRFSVPFQVDFGSQQFAGYFDQLYKALIELRDRF